MHLPDQTGRAAVVTGATGGLGLRVAEVLAASGAEVYLGSRNPDRGANALERVRAVATGAHPRLVELDLASMASVRAAASMIRRSTGDRLDLLINNGGIMAPPLCYSIDGFELQWATNVVGPWTLTTELEPALRSTPGSRVVWVSSTRHASAQLDEARVRADLTGSAYRGFDYYGRTKLADLLLSHELERRYRASGAETLSVAAHPGFTATGIVGTGFAGLPRAIRPIVNWGMDVLGQPVAIGALSILFAATSPDVHGDGYYGPRSFGGLRGYPGIARRSGDSLDDDLAEMLARVVAGITAGP